MAVAVYSGIVLIGCRGQQVRNLLARGAEKNLFGYYTGEAGVWDKVVRAYESKGKLIWRRITQNHAKPCVVSAGA